MTQPLRDQLQATLSGTHTLERELGGGGMSKVFVAEEKRLRRKVVVKVLSPELAQGISIERFEREIQTAAALQQANIVPVLSAGDTNGLPFYTMPFVTGESLRARLARGALPIGDVVNILRDVARALAYAHRQGVVHRDIKPDNVLLSEGAAVVTDFGIAKAISAARTSGAGATLTQVGTSIGTPAYMAPEQAAGDPAVDHRADIYSLGAMAYELLSGQVVFPNRTPQRMLAAHMGEAPTPVSALRPDTPPQLADLVMQCLSKEAGDRPQDATQVALGLETTGGGSMAAMPAILLGGPGMFRKAIAAYAAAFVVVAILAKAAIVGIGLPDWVFPGSLIVMALGLPAVLWTGYVQRVVRRVATATPTLTPGGTPAMTAHGTIATMALKAAPHVSWYRTARGGMYAFGAFVAIIGAFMAMRAFGVGPFGSLLATGALARNDAVLFTEFTTAGGDSTLGRVVSDAVRAGLAQSSVFSIMTPEQVAAGLRRMQRSASARIDLALARQLAQREGAKAVVDGDVTTVGGSYIVAIRLVTADSGRELTSFRATVSGPDKLIEAADQVARQLRGKAGESLRKVQGGPPLARVTTGSLDALRRYSEANRVSDAERDYARAETLLREAVAIDSGFAEGWRKLGVVLGNQGKRAAADSASTRAYQLRDRLNERERDLIVGSYFVTGPGRDRARGIAAYEALLARGDSQQAALNNLANAYDTRREFARAESLFAAMVRLFPASQQGHSNGMTPLLLQGKWAALDSAIAANIQLYPRSTDYRWRAIERLREQGKLDAYRKVLDSVRTAPDTAERGRAVFSLASLHEQFGQNKEAARLRAEARGRSTAPATPESKAYDALSAVNDAVRLDRPFDAELRALDAVLATDPFQKVERDQRQFTYSRVVSTYATARRPDRAREYLVRLRALVTDSAARRALEPLVQSLLSDIAVAEKQWAVAVEEARKSERLPDGPANQCVHCLPRRLLEIFAEAGMADSAIAQHDAYRRTPQGSRPLDGPDLAFDARTLERIAKMYDLKGDTVNAAQMYRQFIERLKDADPEFQPRVAAARARLAKLAPVEKP